MLFSSGPLKMQGGTSIVEIRTTFGTRADAEACAARLVGQRLAACVQVEGPVQSTYRWQSVVERAEEFRCTCKTTHERSQACIESLIRDHAYQIPEVICAEVTASTSYADWVRASVACDECPHPSDKADE
jgi:periplasmic divalent cation tolerance protein